MHSNNKYKEMVFYIEACESGSMFNQHKLSTNINVFATTAANGAESSYAVYYDKKRGTYLGDVYSVKWLEDSDKANFNVETLKEQFDRVKQETNTSHVMEFGDLSMGNMVIGNFQGEVSSSASFAKAYESSSTADAVPSPMVPMMILYNSIKNAQTIEEKDMYRLKLQQLQETHSAIHDVVNSIVKNVVYSEHKQKHILAKTATPTFNQCYKTVVTGFRNHCFDFNKYEHALRHVYVFANLCDEGIPTGSIMKAIQKACPVAY